MSTDDIVKMLLDSSETVTDDVIEMLLSLVDFKGMINDMISDVGTLLLTNDFFCLTLFIQ